MKKLWLIACVYIWPHRIPVDNATSQQGIRKLHNVLSLFIQKKYVENWRLTIDDWLCHTEQSQDCFSICHKRVFYLLKLRLSEDSSCYAPTERYRSGVVSSFSIQGCERNNSSKKSIRQFNDFCVGFVPRQFSCENLCFNVCSFSIVWLFFVKMVRSGSAFFVCPLMRFLRLQINHQA